MNIRKIYDMKTGEQSAVSITGEHSVVSVELTIELLNDMFNGDVTKAFHEIKQMQNSGLMPRLGSVARPLDARAIELYQRNVALGKRHWQWIYAQGPNVRASTGYDYVYGYGYYTERGFVIVDRNDDALFVVECPNSLPEDHPTVVKENSNA